MYLTVHGLQLAGAAIETSVKQVALRYLRQTMLPGLRTSEARLPMSSPCLITRDDTIYDGVFGRLASTLLDPEA